MILNLARDTATQLLQVLAVTLVLRNTNLPQPWTGAG
jgi:hypothetical protein